MVLNGRVALWEVIVLLYDASKFTSTGSMAVTNRWRLRGSPEASGFCGRVSDLRYVLGYPGCCLR